MAEINELLGRAAEESEALARQAEAARETVEQLLRLGTALGEVVEAGQAETHERLQQAAARLVEAEQDLLRDGTAARGALAGLLTASRRLQDDVAAFLARIHTDLADLRADREQALGEVEAGADAAQAAAARYLERLQQLEAAAEARLVQGRQDVARLGDLLDLARSESAERTSRVLAQLEALEDSARTHFQALLQAYESTAAAVEEQLGEGQAQIRTRADEVVAVLDRKLAQEVLDRLAGAMEPFRDALAGLEKVAERPEVRRADRFTAIGEKVQEVTRILANVKGPLDMVRHHLS